MSKGAKGGVCLSDLIAELNQAGTANDTAEARQLGCERLMSRAVRQAFSAWSDPTVGRQPQSPAPVAPTSVNSVYSVVS